MLIKTSFLLVCRFKLSGTAFGVLLSISFVDNVIFLLNIFWIANKVALAAKKITVVLSSKHIKKYVGDKFLIFKGKKRNLVHPWKWTSKCFNVKERVLSRVECVDGMVSSWYVSGLQFALLDKDADVL